MTLAPGSSLGAYEVLSPLGAGGMGEVYRARDTKLGRDVAIKILPEAFAQDPERLARFQREAQMLAALNHPHIAAIYGLHDAGGATFLVLELVEGESLAERLARPEGCGVAESLRIARQIVDALEAAHDKGIVHRDLKPGNIMLTADGQVKVLDFGLAKIDAGSASAVSAADGMTHSPTLTFAATQAGVILGTAAYMSPEQAKGRAADKRSDVWAFGAVLFEMLTGKRAFEGEDISDTLAAILRGEPDWTALPPDTPPHVQVILRRCLQKDRKARIPDISVVRFMLDDATSLAPSAETSSRDALEAGTVATARLRRWQIAAGLFAVAAVVGSIGWYVARRATPGVTRFFVAAPDNGEFVVAGRFAAQAALSPDGRTLAFGARDAAGKELLYLRPIDSLVAQPLAGTDHGAYPFWSPDSRSLAYSTPAKLMKIAIGGGPPQTVCTFAGSTIIGRGGTWNRDGLIVFNNGPGPLHRVPAAGGEPSAVLRLAAGQNAHTFPSFLPDGRHVLFHAASSSRNTAGLYVASIDTGETKQLAPADSGAIYDPSSGYLLFVREGTLLAQIFDPKTLTLVAEPIPVAEHVETQVVPGIASFSLSTTGLLAYGIGRTASAADVHLVWVDRQGKPAGTVGTPANYRGIDLSPNGRSLAAHYHDGVGGGDIWITDLARGSTSRFTFDAAQDNSAPIWSPDGTFVAFASVRGGKWAIYRKPFNNTGEEEKLFESESGPIIPTSWAADNQSIVFITQTKDSFDVWRLPLTGDRKPVPLVRAPFTELHPQISADGRWMAYSSNESGRPQVVVVPFPSGPGKWQVSIDGGTSPRWRRDGRELFFMSESSRGKMMAVDVKMAGVNLEFGTPRLLFDSEYVNRSSGHPNLPYAVTADGQRFLIPRAAAIDSKEAPVSIAVVANWADALKR